MRVQSVATCLLLTCVGLEGCGSDPSLENRPQTVSVSGVVTFKGQPVSDATVTFVDASELTPGQAATGHSAVGRTDSNGQFKLTTFESNDGAVPGEYAVTVTKFHSVAVEGGKMTATTEDGASLEGEGYVDPSDSSAEDDAPKNLLPEKYAAHRSSGLTATVAETGENKFEFTLEE